MSSGPRHRPINLDFIDLHGVCQADVGRIRQAANACPVAHQGISYDQLTFGILCGNLDVAPDAKIVCFSATQPYIDLVIAEVAAVDEEPILPAVRRPHSAQARVDILRAVVIEIEKHDPVPLWDRPGPFEHGNVLGAQNTIGSL